MPRPDLIWGEAFFAGSLAQLLARLSGLPGVVLLLAVGLVMGRAGLNLVAPEALGDGLEPVVLLLVSLILFDGGLNLRLAGRDLQRAVLRLVLVRSLLGLLGAAVLAHGLAGLSWSLAWVFGAIALATGPTVVNPLVHQIRLKQPLGEVLEAEGLILEPFSAVLALLLLQLALGDLDRWQEVTQLLALRFGGGLALGAASGWLLAALLRRLPTPSPALTLQLSLGMLFLLVSGAEHLLPEAGLPAAVSAGVVLGLLLGDEQTGPLDELMAQLAQLAITVLFPLLAADVSWPELSPLGLGGVLTVLALMAYRLLVMQLGALGMVGFGWREKLIVGWIAPRGIVTAAIASLFALRLNGAGLHGGGALKGLVFLTILLTVGIQGFTAPLLAQRLGLVDDPADATAAVAGAEPVQAPG
ncbi:MAG: cation:proton antiporter [Cyanobacteriota bacterium]|nr:cation:proton antiporter [Cyanobacteriota bacterium]